jgi:hypothetical protein
MFVGVMSGNVPADACADAMAEAAKSDRALPAINIFLINSLTLTTCTVNTLSEPLAEINAIVQFTRA